eukprot:sb/3473935/
MFYIVLYCRGCHTDRINRTLRTDEKGEDISCEWGSDFQFFQNLLSEHLICGTRGTVVTCKLWLFRDFFLFCPPGTVQVVLDVDPLEAQREVSAILPSTATLSIEAVVLLMFLLLLVRVYPHLERERGGDRVSILERERERYCIV